MLQFFRTNQLLFSLLLFPYALLLRYGGVQLLPLPGSPGIWGADVHAWVAAPTIRYVLGCLLLTFQAVYLNRIVNRNRLARDPSQFAGLFYVLVSSLFPAFLDLSGPLLANTFLIVAFGELCETYKKNKAAIPLFNAGLWIGVASLFYGSYLLFLIWAFAGINSLRKPSLQEWLVALLGTVCVYWLVGTGYYLIDAWPRFFDQQLYYFGVFDVQSQGGWADWMMGGIFGVLILYVLTQAGNLLLRKTIDVRKKLNLLYVGLLFSPLVLVLQADVNLEALLIAAVPLGTLLSLRLLTLRPAVAEALHLLAVAAILLYQFRGIFG